MRRILSLNVYGLSGKRDHWAAVLAVLDVASNRVAYFETLALPFGAVSAVTGFNRTSRALRMILCRLLYLVTTGYFDDFCQMEIEALADSADEAALGLLELLGWEVAKGDKLKPFESVFTILGAQFSFEDLPRGYFHVSNKPGRLDDIEAMVASFCKAGPSASGILPSLKGKLLYASGHVFGKCAQIATQMIRHYEQWSFGERGFQSLCKALQRAADTLREAGPRSISLWCEQPPIIIFTDGACEEAMTSHGAVICDPVTNTFQVFGEQIPASYTEKWSKDGKKQLVFMAELLPVLVAKRTWASCVRGRRVLLFLDNQAAQESLIRGYSPVVDAADILADIFKVDVDLRCLTWVCRVPSKSNPSDAASRLDFSWYEGRFMKVHPCYQ